MSEEGPIKDLRAFVAEGAEEEPTRRVKGAPRDEQRKLQPVAQVGKDVHKLLPDGFLEQRHFSNDLLLSDYMSDEMKAYILSLTDRARWAMIYGDSLYEDPAVGSGLTLMSVSTTLASTSHADFSMPSDGRIRYDGTDDITVDVWADIETSNVSGYGGAAGNLSRCDIYKNGVAVDADPISAEHYAASSNVVLHPHTQIEMSTDDYVELYYDLTGSATNYRVNCYRLGLRGTVK